MKKLDYNKLEKLSYHELLLLVAGIEGMLDMDIKSQVEDSIDHDNVGHKFYMEGYILGGNHVLKNIHETIHALVDDFNK